MKYTMVIILMSYINTKTKAPDNHHEADMLHLDEIKLCRILHGFEMCCLNYTMRY